MYIEMILNSNNLKLTLYIIDLKNVFDNQP